MQTTLNQDLIESAFRDDIKLRKRVFDAIESTPEHTILFEDIARYAEQLRFGTEPSGDLQGNGEPSSKKRKIEQEPTRNGAASNPGLRENQDKAVIFEAKDVSFQIPVRKKLNLEIARNNNAPVDIYTVQARNAGTGTIEYEGVSGSFDHILKLPVPEKAQKQYNFCLIPTMGLGLGDKAPKDGFAGEPLLWTVNDGAPLSVRFHDPRMQNEIGGSDQVLESALEYTMRNSKKKVTYPDDAEFISATPELHRKGEKAYHVKAFRGSKDGYLFFLSDGVFFGFKKPLQFFSLDDIRSISYTSVLQRTFNLNIAYSIGRPTPEDKEVEFSMIDQTQFAGIDAYIKRHALQDASMAEARKAKRHNINARKTAEPASATNGEEPGELQKAEQQLQDEEDEEDELEEDYDPGSEGESEGSGASSEEEDDDYAHGEVGGGDLVEDELGSEAEDVEPDPEDDDQL